MSTWGGSVAEWFEHWTCNLEALNFKSCSDRYNPWQNKMEQQTPIPPNQGWSRAKGKNMPFSHLWFGGMGGQGFPFILSKIVAGFVHGSAEFKSFIMLVNSQLVCQLIPSGACTRKKLSHIHCYCMYIIICKFFLANEDLICWVKYFIPTV